MRLLPSIRRQTAHVRPPARPSALRAGAATLVAAAVTVAASGVAAADNVVVGGDVLVVAGTPTMAMGNICAGGSAGKSLDLWISRQGNSSTQVFANNTLVTFSAVTPLPAGVSVAGLGSVATGGGWSGAGNGTTAGQGTPDGTLTVTPTTAPGVASSANVTFSATGGTVTRSATLAVTWTVVACDTTAPVVTPSVTGTLGSNGWYTSDAVVSWSVSDPDSPISASTGCTTSTVSSDTSGVTFTCSATSAGGTTTKSVTVKRDATKPVISAALSPARPLGGWWNISSGAPTVAFTCSDATSGVTGCPGSHLFGEGADQTWPGTVTDNAGNTATAAATDVDVDLTAPVVTGTPSGTEGDNGWYIGDITVSWAVDGGTSGLGTACADDVINTDDAAAQSATCTEATDGAGNHGTGILNGLYRDATPPTIQALIPAPNGANGWYTTAPTVTFPCSDDASGIDGTCPDDVTFVDGVGQSASGSVTDLAGNTSAAGVVGIDVDTVAPAVSYTLTGTTSGGWYTSDITVDWTVTDGGSGISGTPCPSQTRTTDGLVITFSCTATDEAGNATTVTTTAVKRDTTAPSVTVVVSPDRPASGWWNLASGAPTVTFTCSDGGAGLAVACPDPVTAAEGEDGEVEVTVADLAGNETTTGATNLDVDLTAPDLTYAVIGPQHNDWYTGASTTIQWSASDLLSGVDASPCPDDVWTVDGTGLTADCIATDAAGNATTVTTAPIRRDATPPTITAAVSPAAPDGSNGWYRTAPVVTFTCSDSGSGLDGDCPDPVTVPDGENGSASGSVTDQAGNEATVSVTDLDVDTAAPAITYTLSPATPVSGWYTGDVTVHWSVVDDGSGVDGTPCPDETISVDGVGQTASCSATDRAGNTASATTDGIDRDATKPTITGAVSPAAPNGSNGWYTTAPTVSFTCGDATSGIASCSGPTTLGEAAAAQSVTGTALDHAGNSATATVSGLRVDLTAPTNVQFVGGPGSGATYPFGSMPAAPTCTASDAASGIASCVVTGYATTLGSHTMTATATDQAGRTASVTRSYTVQAWRLKGFYQPTDMGNVWNTVKNGSTVPLKFEVFGGSTEYTATSVVKSFSAAKIACSATVTTEDAIELVTTGSTVLRYDTTAGQFIQNWKTPTVTGCYKVTMTTQDGSSLSALFKLV